VRGRLAIAAVAAVVLLSTGAGFAVAAFVATTSNPANTFSSATSFASQTITRGYDLRDASGGAAETNSTWAVAFDDTRLFRTTVWANAYAATRYVEFDMNAPLPTGRQIPTANFRMKFASAGGAGSGNACFYFEVRRISTGAVLGTHGSSASPVACSAGTTQFTSTTDITADIASSTIADDIRIRVYGWETGTKAWDVESATVTGTTPLGSFTLYPDDLSDAADASAASTVWSQAAAGDGVVYTTLGNWTNAFAAARYLKVTFPAYVPAGSTVTSASVTHTYKNNNNGITACWYFEVYNGASLIGTHGSTATPAGCNATNAFVSDTVPIPEVDTVAEANNVTIKMFFRTSTSNRATQHDQTALTINY
jgi:hypothetical protein